MVEPVVMSALGILLAILLLFYVGALLWLSMGFHRLRRRSVPGIRPEEGVPRVSVIVAARNEEANLGRLLSCLRSQQYPSDAIEFLIADDRSSDHTPELLAAAGAGWDNLRVLRIEDVQEGFAPKKRALDAAIRNSRGDILLLTDADCSPPPTWVRAMVGSFGERTAMVIGFSPYRFDRQVHPLLRGMLALEYFSLMAVAAGAAGAGFPLTATGTNLAYRKTAYEAVGGFGGFRHWVSGDDDLLMHQMRRKGAGEISFALSPEAAVPAAAPTTVRQFWHQRTRYASKGLAYDRPVTAGLMAVYALNALLAAGAILGPLSGTMPALAVAVAWGIKTLAELGFLFPAARTWQCASLLRFLLPTALLHPFYVTLFGLLGTIGSFEWKGSTS
jgi:cellulose synthase/poly-beta-1,6-N-acetylglucosamine synthase-like glycosyltransferase